jgi:hypothetical protein
MLALFAYNLITYIRLKRRMATAVRFEGNVFEAEGIGSPFILGFFRPRIYLPFGLSGRERGYVLSHERYHLKKKDYWVKLLGMCVLVPHWFNPLVWVAFSLMCKDMEMRCDEQVLSSACECAAKDYSRSLLAFATPGRPAAAPLAFGETGVRSRIKHVLRFREAPRRARIAAALLCVAALAACAANPPQENDAIRALYGDYVFDSAVYSNPASSSSAPYGEAFKLTGTSLVVKAPEKPRKKYSLNYQKVAIDKQDFEKGLTTFSLRERPLLDGYQECYQLAESPDSAYRLYQMDGELWLEERGWRIFRITKADGTNITSPTGEYVFERAVMMSPLSSFFPTRNYREYYDFSKHTMTITGADGICSVVAMQYQKEPLLQQPFDEEVQETLASLAADYNECYQLATSTDGAGYRLCQMDDELWLVKINPHNNGDAAPQHYIWSIYSIIKADGAGIKISVSGTRDGTDAFLALQGGYVSEYEGETCYNITSEHIKQKSRYQIFKYDKSFASFLLYEDSVYPLGVWFGGLGVTSMDADDINGDGLPELYFTYSWGSGVNRSHAAYFDPVAKQVVELDYVRNNGDMLFATDQSGLLSLFSAKSAPSDGFADFALESTGRLATVGFENGQISLHPVSQGLTNLLD